MSDFIDYGCGIILPRKVTNKVAEAVVETIKKELPEEAHCKAVIYEILSESEELIRHRRIVL